MKVTEQSFFKASPDKYAKRITVAVIVLIACFTFFLLFLGFSDRNELLNNLILIAVFWILLGLWYIQSVQGYQLKENVLVVKRVFRSRPINLNEIKEISILSEKEFTDLKMISGSAGLFGYSGVYSDDKSGRMKWFATQKRNFIMLHLISGQKIVITPDDLSLAAKLKTPEY